MRLLHSFSVTTMILMVFLFNFSQVQAYSPSDYYNAGLQLYNAKNYPEAIQYFSAAIQLDPNNLPALQGRANCYYLQGQYPQALQDYQRVESLSPSDQLSQFIQSIQAKVGSNPPSSPIPSQPQSDKVSFNQGVALFNQKQFSQAVAFFQKALQENPNDSQAFYYLGIVDIQLGDLKDAAVALGRSNQIQPSQTLATYVAQLKTRLSPADEQWVNNQIASGGNAGNSVPSKMASNPNSFGVRLEPSIVMLSLADFNTNASSLYNQAKLEQSSDPSFSYNGEVPTGAPAIGIEPVLRIGTNMEVGVPLSYLPIGTVSDASQDNNSVTMTDSYNISAFSVGLNLRYFFLQGDWQPFVSAGGLIVPISIAYSSAATVENSYSYSASGTFEGMDIGGQISAGLDWHLGNTFVVTPFAGYQFVGGNSFQATLTNNSGGNNSGQTAQLDIIPTSVGNVVAPVSNGKLVLPISNGTQSTLQAGSEAPSGSRPLDIDLSGPYGGIQLSGNF